MAVLGKAAEQDLFINQGSKFELTVGVTDVAGAALSMSGWTAKMDIRPARGDSVVHDTYNTGNEITLVTGQVQIDVPGSQTAAYAWKQAMYDLYLINGTGEQFRILQGMVTVDHSVTVLP